MGRERERERDSTNVKNKYIEGRNKTKEGK